MPVMAQASVPDLAVQCEAAETSNTTPTWTWTGSGSYRYQLDAQTDSGWKQTKTTTYTPTTALKEGSHTLYVQEVGAAGAWTRSRSASVKIDLTPPGAPLLSVQINRPCRPTWSWSSNKVKGNGTFRYQLDSNDQVTTTALSYTPTRFLNTGAHTFSVQERDTASNWSTATSSTLSVTNAAHGWWDYR